MESPRVYLNLVILLLTEVHLHCMCSFPQEIEVAVQAKQPDVEGILSKGQHLYKEKPATQPVKVMKRYPLPHNGLCFPCCTFAIDVVYL